MYHVIKNQKDLDAWMQQIPDKASVIQKHKGIKNALKEAVATLDRCYGEDRRIDADLGGFTVVLYGSKSEVAEHFQKIVRYFHLNETEYEYRETFEHNGSERTECVTFWLFLCSSDYAVQIVTILEKESKHG